MRRICALLAVMLLAGAGCQDPARDKDKEKDKITYVSAGDARMNAAMSEAKATIGQFIAALRAPKETQQAFAIKMPFTDGQHTEHMWLSPVTFDGKSFHGVINNKPEQVKTVQIGQNVTVSREEISDWMYLDNGKLVGGYTLHAIRETMTPAERVEFDKSVPFEVR